MQTLKEPRSFVWDARLEETDKAVIDQINASLARLNEGRALEINVEGPLARSKLAWKLLSYHHALLHRVIALIDGTAVAWNCHCTLSAILSARAFMETFAVMDRLEDRVTLYLEAENLGGLDSLGQNGVFATRDEELLKEFPDLKAVNVLSYVAKYDQKVPGFTDHYSRLSERCHPNALGHNFMFAKLDRSNGSINYSDENEPNHNARMIFAAICLLPLVEALNERMHELVIKVSDLQHRLAPVCRPPKTTR